MFHWKLCICVWRILSFYDIFEKSTKPKDTRTNDELGWKWRERERVCNSHTNNISIENNLLAYYWNENTKLQEKHLYHLHTLKVWNQTAVYLTYTEIRQYGKYNNNKILFFYRKSFYKIHFWKREKKNFIFGRLSQNSI